MMNTHKLCEAIKVPVALFTLSIPAFVVYAGDSRNYDPESDVQTTVLRSGQGYELKEMLFTAPDGQRKTSTLYFIHSAWRRR